MFPLIELLVVLAGQMALHKTRFSVVLASIGLA